MKFRTAAIVLAALAAGCVCHKPPPPSESTAPAPRLGATAAAR
jgi:hypothetical protein